MAKIKLTVEIEVPDVEEFSKADLAQLLADTYTHYTATAHMRDALKWCAKARCGAEDEDPAARSIYQHHKTWGEICHNASWSFEVLDGTDTNKS